MTRWEKPLWHTWRTISKTSYKSLSERYTTRKMAKHNQCGKIKKRQQNYKKFYLPSKQMKVNNKIEQNSHRLGLGPRHHHVPSFPEARYLLSSPALPSPPPDLHPNSKDPVPGAAEPGKHSCVSSSALLPPAAVPRTGSRTLCAASDLASTTPSKSDVYLVRPLEP